MYLYYKSNITAIYIISSTPVVFHTCTLACHHEYDFHSLLHLFLYVAMSSCSCSVLLFVKEIFLDTFKLYIHFPRGCRFSSPLASINFFYFCFTIYVYHVL